MNALLWFLDLSIYATPRIERDNEFAIFVNRHRSDAIDTFRSIRNHAKEKGHTSLTGISIDELAYKIGTQLDCEICGGRNKDRRLYVDHCHDSGQFRGMLCSNCNTAIGFLERRPDLIENMQEYLKTKKRKSMFTWDKDKMRRVYRG